jgi:hypothetical protein
VERDDPARAGGSDVVSDKPADGGPWRGPSLEQWLPRIAAPILREGETLPLIKPLVHAVEDDEGEP